MAQQVPAPESGLRTQPKQPDKSLGELVGDMTGELSTLMRKEVELAKVELKEEVGRAGKAGGMLGGGAVSAYFALLFASLALAWLLDSWMPVELAFLLVAVPYAIAAAILISRGREQMKQVDPVPRQTVETVKEDVAWARAQRS
jgi:uncharacterized membrane protein YqjE